MVENVSQVVDAIPIQADIYLDLFDRILPQVSNQTPESIEKVEWYLLQLISGYTSFEDYRTVWLVAKFQFELTTLPWLIQQGEISEIPVGVEVPSDNLLQASFRKQEIKISLSPASFYGFAVLSGASLGWCLFRIFQYSWGRRPRQSSFPDISLLEKLPDGVAGGDNTLRTQLSKLLDIDGREIDRVFGGIRLYITERGNLQHRNDERRGGYDMDLLEHRRRQ